MSATFGLTAAPMSSRPDPRAENAMCADIRGVHSRLMEWAKWSRESAPNDWPRSTLLGRFSEQGTAIFSHGHRSNEMPLQVAEVERAVIHLTGKDRKAIERYYLHWEPKEVRARACGLTVRAFETVLNRARWRIAGYLSAI